MGREQELGVKGGDEMESIAPSPLSAVDEYLIRVYYIIGKPVEVHIKDGSVYSGEFFATSPDGEGIALKKAELTKKKGKPNVPSKVAETLIIPSKHIAQVVTSEGIKLSVNDVASKSSGGVIEAPVFEASPEGSLYKAMETKKYVKDSESRQVEQETMQDLQDDYNQKSEEVQASNSSTETCLNPVEPTGEGDAEEICKPHHSGGSNDSTAVTQPQYLERSPSANTPPDVAGSSAVTSSAPATATAFEIVPPQNLESSNSSKESKLNPKAKDFFPFPSPSPSFVKPTFAGLPAVPTAVNIGYMPGNSPMYAVVGSQPKLGTGAFAPRPSPYSDLGNGMNAPMGQYLYMQPMIHEPGQGAAGGILAMPQRPPFVPHQVQHQGQPMQLYAAPPFIHAGQQQLALASQMPPMQPFPATRPMPGP